MARKLLSTFVALALSGAALLVGPSSSIAASCPDANAWPGTVSGSAEGDAILCLLNEQRVAFGLVPLSLNTYLSASAYAHSTEMNSDSYFAHDSADGTTFDGRIRATGYLNRAHSWAVGENIAWGSLVLGTPQALMVAWMNSPEHRANILDPTYREIGIGVAWGDPLIPNAPAAVIATTDFGSVKYAKKKHHRKKHHR
jgi:uncharacterized protein YkwD